MTRLVSNAPARRTATKHRESAALRGPRRSHGAPCPRSFVRSVVMDSPSLPVPGRGGQAEAFASPSGRLWNLFPVTPESQKQIGRM